MLRNDSAPVQSLNGTWQFSLGESGSWAPIQVPACWEAQGYSKWIDGPARYRREFTIPDTWVGQRLFLEFDAVSYATSIWCNGVLIGQHQGMWTPFALDITSIAQPGRPNTLALEVYKPGDRYPVRRCLAGFLPDVATTFGGIWQSTRLRALQAGFQDLRFDADPDTGTIHIRGRAVHFHHTSALQVQIDVLFEGRVLTSTLTEPDVEGVIDATLSVPSPVLWSPQQPALYRLRLRLLRDAQVCAETEQRVGFRRLSRQDEQLLFNGSPAFLRGVLSWGWHPERIAPNFSDQEIRAEIGRVRDLGFNLIKLCLFVPNQRYFEIADEEGMFLWLEWPLWLPAITPEMYETLPREYAALMRLAQHHPSIVLYSVGCELSANVDEQLLRRLTETVREAVSGVLICDNSGSGEAYGGLTVDFSDFNDYHTYGDLQHFEPVLDHWRRDWKTPRPWIFGEFCDSDGFRDLDELIAAHGGQKPWWMTTDLPVHTWRPEARALLEAHERLARANLGFTTAALVDIAKAQSYMVRKYTLETVRRRAGMGGYVITGLRDTPIATSGVFDDFDRPKWPADEFRPINGESILCLDVERRRRWRRGGDQVDRLDVHNWWAGSTVRLHVILHHVMPAFPTEPQLTWTVTNQAGMRVAEGIERVNGPTAAGRPREIAVVAFQLPNDGQAQEYRLTVQLGSSGVLLSNRWPLWSYPPPTAWPDTVTLYDPCHRLEDFEEIFAPAHQLSQPSGALPDVLITATLDEDVEAYLNAGGKVLLIQQSTGPLPARQGPFWREAIKLFPAHRLWDEFPQRGYADMQFFGLATDVSVLMDRLPKRLPRTVAVRPIMRRLDAREFDVSEYLLEAEVGQGRLLVCTLRLQGGAGSQPTGLARNVAGQHLLHCMIAYLASLPS